MSHVQFIAQVATEHRRKITITTPWICHSRSHTSFGIRRGLSELRLHLLAFYEEERTLQIIRLAERETSPQAKLERVMQATLQPSQLDVAMRAWALQDGLVRDHQQRIDQRRLTYLEELIYARIGDHCHATRMARLFYCIYVGSQHIVPPVQGADLAQLYQEALPLLNVAVDTPLPKEG